MLRQARAIILRDDIETVVLCGGAFQNRLISEAIIRALEEDGVTVLLPELLPANDGGIALGQAAIAAAQELK